MNLSGNTTQTLVQNAILFNGVTSNTFSCKNQNTLILDITISGLDDKATLSSFKYTTIYVTGKNGSTSYPLQPSQGYVNGTKISGQSAYQFVLNGRYYLLFDVSNCTEVIVSKGVSSTEAVIEAKCSLVEYFASDKNKINAVKFSNTRNIINMPVEGFVKMKIEVKNMSDGGYVQLFTTASNATDNNVVGNNIKAISYPEGSTPSSSEGGISFFDNGIYEIVFDTALFDYLRVNSNISGTAIFSANVISLNHNPMITREVDVKNGVQYYPFDLIGKFETNSFVINTYGRKFIRLTFSGNTSDQYSTLTTLGFEKTSNNYTKNLDVYSESKNWLYNEYPPFYSGSINDSIVIYAECVSKVWIKTNNLHLDKKSIKVEYIDDYLIKDIELKFRKNSNNTWSYDNPRYDALCAFCGFDYTNVQWLRIEYDYKKGYTQGLNIAPTFMERWSKDVNLENRPRFYNIYGDKLMFKDVYQPQNYKHNYCKLLYDSEDVYFVETTGKMLSTIGITPLSFQTDDSDNPFSLIVRLSVSDKSNFYKSAKTFEYSNFRVEINDHRNYRFANQARYKDAHIYGGGGNIYLSGDGARYYKVAINSTNFPNLPEGNKYPTLYVCPSSWSDGNGFNGALRMCVIVNGKIYHNYPASVLSSLSAADKEKAITMFEESNVWDLPVRQSGIGRTDISCRKLPSKLSETQIAALEGNLKYIYKYYPVLPDNMYYGDGTYKYSNESNSKPFHETWKEGEGLVVYPRYYNFRGVNNASMMASMMTPAISSKMMLIGHYFTTSADRALAIASADGANWFVKFDYASLQNPSSMYHVTPLHGNDIWTANIGEPYNGGLKVAKRSYTVPTNEVKEPSSMFVFSSEKTISAITISNGTSGNETAVITCNGHGLTTRDVIVIKTDNYTGAWRCLANDSANINSGGNGTFFVVEKIDENSFKIREYIHSPDHNITARHVHHTNAVKDGFIISAGEEYPDGWIVFLQQKEKDQPVGIAGSEHMKAYRLNSSPTGAYRPSGFIMLDDDPANPTCLYASDESDIPRGEVVIAGRTNMFTRNTSGIYKGRLADIDDFRKWTCVCDADEMILSLQMKGMYLIAFGMAGGLYISADNGSTWDKHMYNDIQHIQLITNNAIYTESSKIVLK